MNNNRKHYTQSFGDKTAIQKELLREVNKTGASLRKKVSSGKFSRSFSASFDSSQALEYALQKHQG